MLRILLAAVALATLSPAQALLDSDVTTGTLPTAQILPAHIQRALDLTVLGAEDRYLESVQLKGVSLQGAGSGVVIAQIFDVSSAILVACETAPVIGFAAGLEPVVPIVAVLEAGKRYRVSVRVFTGSLPLPTAILYQPTSFPYIELTGAFRIENAYQGAGDAFPFAVSDDGPHLVVRHRGDESVAMELDPSEGAEPPTGPFSWFGSTRASDLQVISPTGFEVEAITVRGIDLTMAPFTVGVRVYHTETGELLASNSVSIPGGGLDLTVSLPVPSVTLRCGEGYRIGAYVGRGRGHFVHGGAQPLVDPVDEGLGVFRILGASSSSGDVFPTTGNILHPQTTVHGRAARPGTNTNTGISVSGDLAPRLYSCTSPRIGKPYRIEVTDGGDATPVATLLLSLPLAPAQSPALGLWLISTPIAASIDVPLVGGRGAFEILLPADPLLIDRLIVTQALVLDLTSPAMLPISHSGLLVSQIGG